MNPAFLLFLALFPGQPSIPAPGQVSAPGQYVISRLLPHSDAARPLPPEDVMRNMHLAEKAVTAFLAAETVEEMAKHVRHPERALPRMKQFYRERKITPVKAVRSENWKEHERDDRTFLLGSVPVDFVDKAVCVEVSPFSGSAMVDWESFVGWCGMPWEEFAGKGSDKPIEFRVAVAASDYYNFSFSDKNLLCFRLTDIGNTETIYAYCKKDSESGKQLLGELRALRLRSGSETELITATLTLTMKAEDVPRRQAVLSSVVRIGWVEP